jgi:hypothetical protein
MNRFLAVVAATAASAVVAAAINLPAGADQNGDPAAKPGDPPVMELASCLRAQGLDVPSAPDELKAWIGQHAEDANAKPAFEACHFSTQPMVNGSGPKNAEEFAACLRHNGADVPANLDGRELKQWVMDHAPEDALKACSGPVVVHKPGPDCAPGEPATPATKAKPDGVGTEAVGTVRTGV